MIGRTLLQYEIRERIGAGGMGEVWRAHDTRLDRDVAIKILPADVASAPVRHERFFREARAASSLIHPNIITIHEINSAEDLDFIVMELVRGETLSSELTRGPLTTRRAVEYAVQICEALKAAHAAGIVHRDLKPGNIMITAPSLVKVLDFGIAQRVDDALAYMSPEQTLGDPIDARSDLFSFGVVLYEMLAGRLPFKAATALSLVHMIVHDPPAPLLTAAPGAPDALVAIVDRCLAKNPDERQASAAALGEDLGRVAAQVETGVALEDMPTGPMKRPAE